MPRDGLCGFLRPECLRAGSAGAQIPRAVPELDRETGDGPSTYWLWPFKNYRTFCPYMVGSYERVSEEVAKYIKAGFTNFILDIPAEERDVMSAGIVFAEAAKKAA